MPTVSPIKKSPIAKYLIENKATCVKTGNICHFLSPEGIYLGNIKKSIIQNYNVIETDIYGENFKKLYSKSVANGFQYAYLKNPKTELGVSIAPLKIFCREIITDFLKREQTITDKETTLVNKLNLIAYNKEYRVGLYDTKFPLKYIQRVANNSVNKIKSILFKHTVH